jgi:hypothetical protein
LALESPNEEVTLGDAKLVSPPGFPVAGKALLNAENPVELPAARLPNGELSEPAKADREDDANADVEAGLLLYEELLATAGSFVVADKVAKGEVAEVDAIEDPNAEVDVVEDLNAEEKGESVDVFPNALEEKVYWNGLCQRSLLPGNQHGRLTEFILFFCSSEPVVFWGFPSAVRVPSEETVWVLLDSLVAGGRSDSWEKIVLLMGSKPEGSA